MGIQTTFKRHELKYQLTNKQYQDLCICMKKFMCLDEYGRHKISNIYFDTKDYRIIRRSIEKPKYKEKLRLRVYGEPDEAGEAFIELKKKFNGIVYKRRVPIIQNEAIEYLCNDKEVENASQISKEVDYFKKSNDDLLPRVYLSYEREAYFSPSDENFRMTFDFNIKMRDNNVSLDASEEDNEVLEDSIVLLEVKTVMGLPPWFIEFLNENQIFSTSFSKYGTAYHKFILPKFLDGIRGTVNG